MARKLDPIHPYGAKLCRERGISAGMFIANVADTRA
jgi:hypothetical protein